MHNDTLLIFTEKKKQSVQLGAEGPTADRDQQKQGKPQESQQIPVKICLCSWKQDGMTDVDHRRPFLAGHSLEAWQTTVAMFFGVEKWKGVYSL